MRREAVERAAGDRDPRGDGGPDRDGADRVGRRARELDGAALRAVEEERRTIARELHDELSQRLALVAVLVRIAEREEGRDLRRRLREIADEVGKATEAVRRIARGLRPPALEETGALTAIRACLDEAMAAAGLAVTWDVRPVDACLDPESRLVLYRVVQEAVSNVLRHADARRLDVRIGRRDGWIVTRVSDDGLGFEKDRLPRGKGLGLLGMRERAAAVGGRAWVESEAGAGTTVHLELPAGAPGSNADRNPAGEEEADG